MIISLLSSAFGLLLAYACMYVHL